MKRYIFSRIVYVFVRGWGAVGRLVKGRLNTWFYRVTLKQCGRNLYVDCGAKIQYPWLVSIGDEVYIGRDVVITSEVLAATLEIGDGVHIASNVFLDYTGNVEVGCGVHISAHATIYSHTHGYDPSSAPVGLEKRIGCKAWIGNGAFLGEKCQCIGKRAIVGAMAVVVKAVPDGGIVVGNPGKCIGLR